MCYEDVKLGLRRSFRINQGAGGVAINLPANGQRVGIRLICPIATAAAGNIVTGFVGGDPATSSRIMMFANPTEPIDELRLEVHGLMVQGEFTFVPGNVFAYSVVEFLDSSLEVAPESGPHGRVKK